MPWYSLEPNPSRVASDPDSWICGVNDFDCTGFDTFPIARWLLLLAALSPLILGWILVRGHKLSWAPGELTMVAGFAAMVLIGYNGIIDKPGTGTAEIGVSLEVRLLGRPGRVDRHRGDRLPAVAGRARRSSARRRAPSSGHL